MSKHERLAPTDWLAARLAITLIQPHESGIEWFIQIISTVRAAMRYPWGIEFGSVRQRDSEQRCRAIRAGNPHPHHTNPRKHNQERDGGQGCSQTFPYAAGVGKIDIDSKNESYGKPHRHKEKIPSPSHHFSNR